MTEHTFERSYQRGQFGEDMIANAFKKFFSISVKSDMSSQRAGIDLLFESKADGRSFTVEVKTDYKAYRTGVAFIETVSVDNGYGVIDGWAYTCTADRIFYLLYVDLVAYELKPSDLRARLGKWLMSFGERSVKNVGYVTRGVIIPLDELERCCLHRWDIRHIDTDTTGLAGLAALKTQQAPIHSEQGRTYEYWKALEERFRDEHNHDDVFS
jgi:hypothetical protein